MSQDPKAQTVSQPFEPADRCNSATAEQLEQAVMAAIVRYGTASEPGEVRASIPCYPQYVARVAPSRRLQNCLAVSQKVEEGRLAVQALLPFLACDPDRSVASTGALSYAVLSPWQQRETEGAERLLELYQQGGLENGPAVFGGLLMTGDRRILDVLRPVRHILSSQDVEVIIHCRSGFLTRATADFYLEWLEQLDSSNDSARYGAVAAGLANLAIASSDQRVLDIERIIPATPESGVRVLAEWPMADYARQHRARFKSLAAQEQGDAIMPVVMSYWGL